VNDLSVGGDKLLLQLSNSSLGRDTVAFLGLKVRMELLCLFRQKLDMVVVSTRCCCAASQQLHL